MDFYNTYLRKCLEKGVSPSKAAIEAGTTKTAVNRWKSGSIPSDATLLKLADYFGCTITPNHAQRFDCKSDCNLSAVLGAKEERPQKRTP